jgi:hypothetical protein
MQDIRNYVPETTHVPRAYNVAATLWFTLYGPGMLFPLWKVLCFYISTFQRMCALPSTVVFCSFLMSSFQVQSGHI